MIFISYAWTDTPIRISVNSELQKIDGLEIFFDKKNLEVSEGLTEGIRKLLKESDTVVAILTESSVKSTAVAEELGRAHELGCKIIPFVSKTVDEKNLPSFLKDVLQIRYHDSELDSALSELIKIIKGKSSTIDSEGKSSYANNRGDLALLQRSNVGRELVETIVNHCQVYQFSFGLTENDKKVFPLFISPNTFIPDDWTRCFLQGILKLQSSFKNDSVIVEIGIGTGVIPVVLSQYNVFFKRYYGFDVDNLAIKISDINIDLNKLSDKVSVSGGTSLFGPEKRFDMDSMSHPYADYIIANVPQVPSLSTGPLRDLFDYYTMPSELSDDKRQWAKRGLLLVAEILHNGKTRLKKNGCFVLNIGARTVLQNIELLVSDLDYSYEIIYQTRVEQDPETDISAYVHFEDTENEKYTFYSEKNDGTVITAKEAYNRMRKGRACYHDIYVMKIIKK